MRIVDPIFEKAQSQGAHLALSDGMLSLNYAELSREIIRLSEYLTSLGIGPGDRLMVVGENSTPLAVLIFAAIHAGAIVVLENARRAPLEVTQIFSHSKPKRGIFVFSNSVDAKLHAEHHLSQIIEDPLLGDFAVTSENPAGSLEDEVEQPDVAAFIYTTGTTGSPKGVMLTHDNMCFIATMMRELRGMTSNDEVYAILPITHIMGIASVLLGGLHAGAHVHLRARFSVQKCLSEIQSLGITALQGATAMFAKLAEQAALDRVKYETKLRFIGAGGAPIDPTVKANTESVFGLALQNGYGLTEAASVCWTRLDEENQDDTIGRPLPGVELRVLDDEGVAVVDGEVGELWVRGPQVMKGYFRNSELTKQVLSDDGWFNTQDLAKITPDGRVFIVGRKKDVIIRSGFKVNPLEVETVLNRHPSIAHSAVIGRPVQGNEEVVAFVELSGSAKELPTDLTDYLRKSLSPYKHPSEITVLDALPLAANGKVLKAQLLQYAKGASQ